MAGSDPSEFLNGPPATYGGGLAQWPPYDTSLIPDIPPIAPPAGFDLVLTLLPAVILVFLSATFSGLTLGLLSLDNIGLEVVISTGEFFCWKAFASHAFVSHRLVWKCR